MPQCVLTTRFSKQRTLRSLKSSSMPSSLSSLTSLLRMSIAAQRTEPKVSIASLK
jgi:hypothetical protein